MLPRTTSRSSREAVALGSGGRRGQRLAAARVSVARGSFSVRPSQWPSPGLPLGTDPCQGNGSGRCQRSVQTSHFPHSFFNWIFGPAGQNKLSTGRALSPFLIARWCPAALGGSRQSLAFLPCQSIYSSLWGQMYAHVHTHTLPAPPNLIWRAFLKTVTLTNQVTVPLAVAPNTRSEPRPLRHPPSLSYLLPPGPEGLVPSHPEG